MQMYSIKYIKEYNIQVTKKYMWEYMREYNKKYKIKYI